MAKVEKTIQLEEDQWEWIAKMVKEYNLPDVSKAVRILIDHAVEEGDADQIFETIRCRHC